MKTVNKKLFSLLLVAIMLVSLLPMQAFATSTATATFWNYNWDGTYVVKSSVGIEAPTMINGVVPEVTAPAGWRFVGWVSYTPGMTFEQVNAKATIDFMSYVAYDSVQFAAKYVKDSYTLSFDAGMAGVANPKSMTVTNGQAFSSAGEFPMINTEVSGYKFGGWKCGDITLNASSWATTKFESKFDTNTDGVVELTAIWMPNEITVNFYAWSGSDYAIIAQAKAKYGEYLKTSDVPTTGLDGKAGYNPSGWQTTAGTDAVAVVPTSVKLTGNTNFYVKYVGEERKIDLVFNTTALDNTKKSVLVGEAIGAHGGKLPTPTLAGKTFIGWFTSDNVQVTDETIFQDLAIYSTLYAKWADAATVRLTVIDKDTGKTLTSQMIPGGAKNESMSVSSINLASYLPSGNTYKLIGYMDQASYNEYLLTKVVKEVDNVTCAAQGTTEIYALVSVVSGNNTGNTGNNTGSGNNNTGNGNTGSNKPADPTNPATGDNSMIVASVTVMTLSAAALVVFMQLRKRKMF